MPAAITQFMDWLRPSSRASDQPPMAPAQIPSSQSADAITTPESRHQSAAGSMKRKTGAEEQGTNTSKKAASAPAKAKKDGSRAEQPPPVSNQHVQQKYDQMVQYLEAEIDNLKRANEQQADEKLSLNREITDLKSALTTASDEHQRQSRKAKQELQEYQRQESSLQTDNRNLKQTIELYRGDKISLIREIADLKSALATASDEHRRQSREAQRDLQEYQRQDSSLQTEIRDLKQAIERYRGDRISLTREITTLKGTLAAATEEHRRQIRKANEEFRLRESSLQDSLQKSAAASQHANHQLRNLQQDAHRREASLRSEIGRLECELAQLQAQNAEHKDKVELAHQAARAIMNKIRSFDTSDTDAEAWFQSRGQSWYTFSRTNAHPDTKTMLDRLTQPDIPELCQALSDFVTLEGPGQELPDKLLNQRGTPQLLLHALLANFICDKVIWSPFWFLEAIALDEGQFGLPLQGSMENLYRYLISLHESDAHQWRSSLARILAVNGLDQPIPRPKPGRSHVPSSSIPPLPSSDTTTTTNKLLAHRREYAQQLAHLFLAGPARFLMREQPGDTPAANPTVPRTTRYRSSVTPAPASPSTHPCLHHITDEIDEALRFSIKIWSGRSNIEKMGLADFQQEPFNGCFATERKLNAPASSSSISLASSDGHGDGSGRKSTGAVTAFGADERNMGAYMELYRGRGEVEACKGQKILVVVQPRIAAVGTEEGERYDDWKARRVWARAQVFV